MARFKQRARDRKPPFGLGARVLVLAAVAVCAAASRPAQAAEVIRVTGPAAAGASDELTRLYRLLLRRPQDIALNLRYAQLAEQRGEYRKALPAYERVLLVQPDHPEALAGLQRVRRIIEPSITQYYAALGAIYESNPRYLPTGARGEAQALASLYVRDERSFGDLRWRTTGNVVGWAHQRENDLNYAFFGADTGPVLDLMPGVRLHPALGAAGAYFDRRWFYSEGAASATFEDAFGGSLWSVRVRAAYRDYDNRDFFASQNGFYADIMGKFSFRNVLTDSDLFIVAPWVRWSDIKGVSLSVFLNPTEPGAYNEWGSRFEFLRTVFDWLVVGANVTIAQRFYRTDTIPGTAERRDDFLVQPGVSILFPNLFAHQLGLRLDYKHLFNRSNDPNHRFDDDMVSATVVARF